MKFTLSWLKDHLETTASLEEIVTVLTSLGLEVEAIDDPAQRLAGFVVARVVTCGRHPNADRLSLCQVDDGSGTLLQVVCGATNVRTDMKVAFARIGQVIPATGQPLKKGRIRDVDSYGMLCSAQELHLGDEGEGILDLETDVAPGAPLSTALDLMDPLIELAITPNRSDCFGIRGIARDLAAAGLGKLKPLSYQKQSAQEKSPVNVTIEDTQACPYFVGRFVRGVRNGQSPVWVQERLKAVGLRPISALVDISNYLVYDLGRPLHMFDAAKINGDIVVRLACPGEALTALNEKTYTTLPEGAIVVADAEAVLALGGIMGGMSSGCTEATTDVFIECALFDPISIANAGRALAITSDARTRLERGVDPAAVVEGIEAATDLVLQWCGGTASEIVAAGSEPDWERTITLSQAKLSSLSGCDISLTEAEGYLRKLGFSVVSNTSTEMSVHVPSWRPDVEGPADLIEEILRLKGYDNIPAVSLTAPAVMMEDVNAAEAIKRLLTSRGLNEAVTWSFIPESLARLFGVTSDALRLDNPISQDLAFMRPSVLPTLLLAVAHNQARGQGRGAFFEIGPQYQEDLSQQTLISGVRFGSTSIRHWAQENRLIDAFDAKADVMAILDWFGASGQMESKGPSYYHPGRAATIRQGNKILAHFGEIHPKILTDMDIRGPIVAFEVFLDALRLPKKAKAAPVLSPYQAVERDFAFVVDVKIPAEQVLKAIEKVDKQLIQEINLFDIYEGDKIPVGQKSLAVQVRLQPQQATLTEAEISGLCDKIVAAVAQATGGALRQS